MRAAVIVVASVLRACGSPSARALVKKVETRCEILVGGAAPLRIRSPLGAWAPGEKGSDEGAAFERAIARRPLLCRVGGTPASKFALLSLATDPKYLRSVKRSDAHATSLDLLEALAAKRAFAVRKKMEVFVWLGAFGDKMLQGDRANCSERSASNGHAYKALAMLATFDARPAVSALVYADADAVPALPEVPLKTYLALAPEADVIGSANAGLPIVMNGGLIVVRRTSWASNWLEAWWARRCGFFDQYALWKSLFEAWRRDTAFDYGADVFQDYGSARRLALGAVVRGLGALVPAGAKWTCGGDCRATFERTGCLVEPLQLPRVLVVPVIPFLDGATLVPPLQGRVDAGYWDAWFCHGFCNTTSSTTAAGRSLLAERPNRQDWHAWPLGPVRRYAGPLSLDTCRKEKSGTLYVCDCSHVAAQRLAAQVAAVAPGRARPS